MPMPNTINIELIRENKQIIMNFTDDGIGYDEHHQLETDKGLGFANIQSRIKSLNVFIISKANQVKVCRLKSSSI
jgi:signal transduction histidine kinase